MPLSEQKEDGKRIEETSLGRIPTPLHDEMKAAAASQHMSMKDAAALAAKMVITVLRGDARFGWDTLRRIEALRKAGEPVLQVDFKQRGDLHQAMAETHVTVERLTNYLEQLEAKDAAWDVEHALNGGGNTA